MGLDILFLSIGGALLFYGGDWLVDGIEGIAAKYRLPPVLVAFVVMGFGTSAPEFFVAVEATLSGAPDIAMGNVVGSNIANLLLVLAVTALIMPLAIDRNVLRIDGGAMLLSALALGAVAADGMVSRSDALLLIAGMLGYLGFRYWTLPMTATVDHDPAQGYSASVFRCVTALVALPAGAYLFIDGAVGIAKLVGVSETIIGLTVVALGTSLPEMASCVAAALRRKSDMVLRGILGSNVFNGTIVLGSAALAVPLPVSPDFTGFWIPVMLVGSVITLIFLRSGFVLSRREASIMLIGYFAVFLSI
ncbi:calcium/sodium antiporter [uncultured Marivita sp.]|uniref:calcium/sodium antiporter n=1 Tax=uncultured Marivita sp. TaxID=888080 RepID=UPI0026179C5D|nr:calcium/sodium antiporter [uncultured Marivita sp.]